MDLIQIGVWDLTIAAALLLIPALMSIFLRLRLETSLAFAAFRTVVQLVLLGLLLEWIFTLQRWYYVVPYLLVMIFIAARTAALNDSGVSLWPPLLPLMRSRT